MRKTGLFLSLLMAMTCFSQTIKISGNEDNSKFRFETSASGHALTGFIYSKIKSFGNGGFACSLADSVLKGNCTLLDSSLKTIISYGLFSEIILSEDGNYVTVANDEFTIRVKYSPNDPSDTTTTPVQTKTWGVYDLKSKKMLLPFKYSYLSKVYKDGAIVFNSGGLFWMNDHYGQGGKFGIINLKGQEICKAKYTYIGSFNDKAIALGVVGGNNMDGINDGDYMAINFKGENIKPNFYLESSPLVAQVYIDAEGGQSLLYSNEVVSLMGFTNNVDTLTRDSLFNKKYVTEIQYEDVTQYDADGYETILNRTVYNIFEKESKIDIWQPLPSNLKYYYDPAGSAVKNWGKYSQYKTEATQWYQVFVDTATTQIASFYSIDSIYVAEYDSLELDFMYPGIYDQNKKVLDKKYCHDVRSGKPLFEKLDAQGFVFINSTMDTINYRYKFICDTIESKMTICRSCYSGEAQFATKYFHKKRMGLLVNEQVVLPPIYKYIISLNESEYLLLDSINNLWNYSLRSASLSRSNLSFDRIVNKRVNSEDSPFTKAELFVVKNPSKQFVGYSINANTPPVVFDSIMSTLEASGFDMNDNEIVYTSYQKIGSLYDNYGDLVLFRGDSVFNYDIRKNGLIFKDKVKNLFYSVKSSSNLELITNPITFKKIKYKSYYYQQGYYLLEMPNKKYSYYNSTSISSNSIKIDSVMSIRSYLIYWNNKKMYLADFTKKQVMVQNKKIDKYFITLLDSAKQLTLVDETNGEDYNYFSYSSAYHDLYKADGIYKSISSKKEVKYTPTNFKADAKEEVLMFVYNQSKSYVLGRTDYIISKNNKKYLCALRNVEIKKDPENEDMVKEFRDKYYEILDSASVFEIPKVKDKFDCKYDLRGTYKADGVLKSATTNKKMPIQNTDSVIAFSSNKEEVDLFAFCKNGKWKVLCINMVNTEEFVIFDEYVFKSFQELLKTLRPYQESSVECDIQTPAKVFDKALSDLDKKAMDGVSWK